MADKPNKSDKLVNGKIPKHIEEAITTRDYATSYEHISSKADYRQLEDKLQKLEAERTKAPGSQDILENIGFAEQDLANIDKVYHDKQNEQLANTIATYTKTRNINERTTTMSSQQRFFRGAKTSPDIYQPTEALEARIQTRAAQVNALGVEVAGRMRGLGTEEIPESLRPKLGQISKLEEEIAFDKRLLKVQSKAGLSTEKMFGRAEEVVGKTSRYFEERGIEERVARRDVRDIAQEEKALGNISKNVLKLQEDYDSALEVGSKKVTLFAEKLDKATSALDKQQKIVNEMNRQGVTGPGGMGWGDVGKVVALGGRAVAHVARSARVMAVDQQREEMSNKAAFAALGNRIYGRANEAIMGGNMDALLELTGGSLEFARKEGMFAKRFTNVAEGVAQVGDVAVGVGNITQAGIGGVKAGMGVGGAVTANAALIAQGTIEATNAAVKVGRMARGGYGAEQALPTTQVALGLSQQMRMMDAKMMQTVYNQGMTTYNSVAGLGGAGDIQTRLMNTETLGRMQGVGLTPERAAQLTAGLRAAGAMSANDAMAVVQGAGAAKQRGILGQEEFVGMAAQLMGAGGGAGDLEAIMAAAVASGMDNSKSISELVSGTLRLSAGLTAAGISGTGSTQNMLAAASQNLIAAGVDPNLAANAAAMSIGNYNQAQSGQAFTLGNIMERSGIRRMGANFNNASAFQLNRMGEMTSADHKLLLDAAKNPDNAEAQNRANQLLKAKGLTEVLSPEGKGIKVEDVRELQKLSFMAAVTDKGALGVRGVDIGKIYEKAVAGEALTDKETALFQEFGGARAEAITSAIKGDDPQTVEPNSKKKLMGAGTEETQAAFKLRELQDAEKRGGGPTAEIFKSLEVTLAGLQENIGPEKIGKVVEDAAANFEVPVLEFKTSTGEFKTAVDKFINWQNSRMGNIGENQPKREFDSTLKDQKHTEQKRVHPKYGM